jgi:mRNA interferase YafQ
MYTIVASIRFKKQLKKIAKSGRYDLNKLEKVIDALRRDLILTSKYSDHQLKGKLQEFRECHIAFDWLLVYRKYERFLILELVATGSHADLFE